MPFAELDLNDWILEIINGVFRFSSIDIGEKDSAKENGQFVTIFLKTMLKIF